MGFFSNKQFDNVIHYSIKTAQTRKSDLSVVSQGIRVFPWKVLGPGDDNSESINTLKVYCP